MIWRAGTKEDVIWANEISSKLHQEHPEDDAIFEERFQIFPSGFLILEDQNILLGYAVSHPWKEKSYPALNTLVKSIPTESNVLYIHDVGIIPNGRNPQTLPKLFIALEKIAKIHKLSAFEGISLAATTRLWRRYGFRDLKIKEVEKSYGLGAQWIRREII